MPVNPNLYDGTIPEATDQLSVSQGDIQNNFGAIQTLVERNHVEFAIGDPDAGKHKWVTLPAQGATPPVGAFTGNEVGLYSFVNPTTTVNELYINKSDGTQIPMTASSQSTNGWSYMPSGLLVKWGFVSSVAGGAQNISFPGGAPTFNNCFSVLISNGALSTDSMTFVNVISPTQFTIVSNTFDGSTATNVSFYYLAIGN